MNEMLKEQEEQMVIEKLVADFEERRLAISESDIPAFMIDPSTF